MFVGVLDELLYSDYMLQKALFWTLAWILALTSATNTMDIFFKIPEPKITCSKSSILVVSVLLNPRPVKFALGKGPKETAPSNPSKGGKVSDEGELSEGA